MTLGKLINLSMPVPSSAKWVAVVLSHRAIVKIGLGNPYRERGTELAV